MSECFTHHLRGSAKKFRRLAWPEGLRRCVVVQPCAPEGLVGVDVADAGDQTLVEHCAFDRRTFRAHSARDGEDVEARIEWVERDVGNGVVGEIASEFQSAEHALVDEAQLGAVGQVEEDASVARKLVVRISDAELATHSEMDDERIGAEREPQVFPLAAGGVELTSREILLEGLSSSDVCAHWTWMQHPDVLDGVADCVALESVANDLDLGQLRQCSRPWRRLLARQAVGHGACCARYRPPRLLRR